MPVTTFYPTNNYPVAGAGAVWNTPGWAHDLGGTSHAYATNMGRNTAASTLWYAFADTSGTPLTTVIPADATLNSVKVGVRTYAAINSTSYTLNASLYKDHDLAGTANTRIDESANNHLALASLPTTLTSYESTAISNVTLSELRGSGLAARVNAVQGGTNTTTTWYLDAVWVTVDYTLNTPVPPSTPTVTVSTVNKTTLQINWTTATGTPTPTYTLETGPSDTGPWTVHGTANATYTSTQHSGLVEGTTYWYRVTASNSAGTATSSSVSGTPAAAPNLSNSFEGGTNGTAITTENSGGASGTPLSVMTASPSYVRYTTTNPIKGLVSAELDANGNLTGAEIGLGHNPGVETSYFRFYARFSALPGTEVVFYNIFDATGSQVMFLTLYSTGEILVANNAYSALFTQTIAANTVFRIEGRIDYDSILVFLHVGQDLDVPAETPGVESVTVMSNGYLNPIKSHVLGISDSDIFGPIVIDEFAIGSETWIGPAGVVAAAVKKHKGFGIVNL